MDLDGSPKLGSWKKSVCLAPGLPAARKIQGVALIGAVALNSVDFATVASNSAVFIHQSNHPRYFFVVFCCVK